MRDEEGVRKESSSDTNEKKAKGVGNRRESAIKRR